VQTRSPSGKRRYFYPDFSTIPIVPVPDGQHLSDFVSEEAIKFLARDDGRPFFLYLPYFSVHGPREAKPDSLAAMSSIEKHDKTDDPIYASMCMDLDQAIGRVLAALDQQGLADNTLVVFASDNGAIARYDNAPFRKGKGWLHEGGIRVPMLMRWPGVVPAAATCGTPTSALDLFPTLCSAANVTPPAECDGVDLLPVIFSGDESKHRDRDLFWHYPTYGSYRKGRFQARPVSAIRCGRHKLLFDYESGAVALYDLAEDPGEDHDLSSLQPLIAEQMRLRLFAWLDQNQSLRPQLREKSERQ
jgi:arylsulfatase A-like enzyme